MNGRRVHLERLRLSLHGVSADIARAAVDGLADELRRRLAGISEFGPSRSGFVSPGRIVIEAPRTCDAAALRALIANRLADAITARPAGSAAEGRS